MRYMFGTDGVRDIANKGFMTPETVLRLGRAYVLYRIQGGYPRPKIIVGRDTRCSGGMLEGALVAGLASAGADVTVAGIIPTPAVSFLVTKNRMQGGAVISASHNPMEYNGVKFLDSKGMKLSDDEECALEEYIGDNLQDEWRPTGASVGRIDKKDGRIEYFDHLKSISSGIDLKGLHIVVDGANGAASDLAPDLWRLTGARITPVACSPDGININDGVGVTKLDYLAGQVLANGADFGVAYDGDADRVQFVDKKGRSIDGDMLIWVNAIWLQKRGMLKNGVVATEMSNFALEQVLNDKNIELFRCEVGDKYVLSKMLEKDCNLGGEQSGHIIPLDYVSTGDGLMTGFLSVKAMQELDMMPELLVDSFPVIPQLLENFKVTDKKRVMNSSHLSEAIEEMNKYLGARGRIYVRPSGTEPLVRVLVEAEEDSLVQDVAQHIRRVIESLSM